MAEQRRRAEEIASLIHDALNQYQVSQTRIQLATEQLAKAHKAGEASAKFLQDAMTHAVRLMDSPADRVELNGVLQELADNLVGVIPDVEIVVEPGPARLWTDVDRTMLLRALDNLVRNAGEAMPDGGIVTLATELQAEGQMVCVRVRDTGTGMDVATLEQIWKPGFTTKDETVRPRGLGLSKVKKFVEDQGGTVRVESTVGGGSEFHLCFPRVLEAA